MKPLVVSFSSGRSSAMMAKILNDEFKGKRKIINIFANSTQEHEKSLEFANNCDTHFGLNLVWVEAVVNQDKGLGTRHKIVSYMDADRTGKVFEDVIMKYGIPNQSYPHCNRELKLAPIYSYLKEVLGDKKFEVAIGIRSDEMDRMSPYADDAGIIYPLVKRNIKKIDVFKWWDSQEFDLEIPEHMGNCTWCWKKSFNKLVTVMDERPDFFDFPSDMEKKYGRVGASFIKTGKDTKFFRGHRSVNDIREIKESTKERFTDHWWNMAGSCSESCDAFSGADDLFSSSGFRLTRNGALK